MPNTIEWSEEEMQLLINLRKERNEDYWRTNSPEPRQPTFNNILN